MVNDHLTRYTYLNSKDLRSSYDAIIIGSGIGGLVCANYLAKEGQKVLLLEKHYVPGGYCSSFRKSGYYFDAAAHYLGGCRKAGQIGRLLSDHGLESRIKFIRTNPSDVFLTKNHDIFIWQDYERFIGEFQKQFSHEAQNIRRFVEYMAKSNPLQLYVDLKDKTFAQVLDHYFNDEELKSAFSYPLGNMALPSTEASALTSVFLYREFMLDGGYYPKGGMQALPDVLVDRFKEYGGDVLFLSPVIRILTTSSGDVAGVKVKVHGKTEVEIKSDIIIANCDPYQLVDDLFSRSSGVRLGGLRKLMNRTPSVSGVMVHMGINHEIKGLAKYQTNVWCYPGRHIDDYYGALTAGKFGFELGFLFFSVPSFHDPDLLPQGKHSIQAIIGAPYRPRSEWERDGLKEKIADRIIERIEHYIPGLSKWIDVRMVSIPPTLKKYTSNYNGAMYGWASTPSQVGSRLSETSLGIEGLYTVGHWSDIPTGHSGVTTVVASGRIVAKTILKYGSHRRSKATA